MIVTQKLRVLVAFRSRLLYSLSISSSHSLDLSSSKSVVYSVQNNNNVPNSLNVIYLLLNFVFYFLFSLSPFLVSSEYLAQFCRLFATFSFGTIYVCWMCVLVRYIVCMCLDPIICAKLYNPQRKELRNRKEIHTERLEESNNQRKQLNEENSTATWSIPNDAFFGHFALLYGYSLYRDHSWFNLHFAEHLRKSEFQTGVSPIGNQLLLIEFALRGKRFHSFPS